MDIAEMETIISKQCVAIVNRSRVYIGLGIITFRFWPEWRAYFSITAIP